MRHDLSWGLAAVFFLSKVHHYHNQPPIGHDGSNLIVDLRPFNWRDNSPQESPFVQHAGVFWLQNGSGVLTEPSKFCKESILEVVAAHVIWGSHDLTNLQCVSQVEGRHVHKLNCSHRVQRHSSLQLTHSLENRNKQRWLLPILQTSWSEFTTRIPHIAIE